MFKTDCPVSLSFDCFKESMAGHSVAGLCGVCRCPAALPPQTRLVPSWEPTWALAEGETSPYGAS